MIAISNWVPANFNKGPRLSGILHADLAVIAGFWWARAWRGELPLRAGLRTRSKEKDKNKNFPLKFEAFSFCDWLLNKYQHVALDSAWVKFPTAKQLFL